MTLSVYWGFSMGTIVGISGEEAQELNDFWAGSNGDKFSPVKCLGVIRFPGGIKRGIPMSLNAAIQDGGIPSW